MELNAAVLDKDAQPLACALAAAPPWFGNEFDGLSADWLSLCDRRLTIPMQPNTDSLNLGVATGIFLYEMTAARR